MKVLVLNSGSSTIKYALFDMLTKTSLIQGLVERIGDRQGLKEIFLTLSELNLLHTTTDLLCIGHRVVHGGEKFCQPTLIDQTVLAAIKDMIPLSPLHNPSNISDIEEAMAYAVGVPQVAVFDTAFHQTIPAYAYHYAVPYQWYTEKGVRRYGFHGTSHFYVAKHAAHYLGQGLESTNLITLHLGNGASMAAIAAGKSIDTTMGMTPLEGLMMGTRSGDLDPAIVFYLNRQGLSNQEIDAALNKQSGLKGVCGENDMRVVHQMAKSGNRLARLALAMYSYRIKKYIGAYFAVLGRVDALVFTGGIGENDAWLRKSCCAGLNAMGIVIDQEKNSQAHGELSEIGEAGSRVKVLVIATNEELEIAQQAVMCCK
ncbi:MAG: acetate kinase [Gammaproteobacteria bacterium]|jgi:acetate kinase|nr:acetate kinase [Gammaproteobacteria bacterium]